MFLISTFKGRSDKLNEIEMIALLTVPDNFVKLVEITNVSEDSTGVLNVEVVLKKSLPPKERGPILLDLEDEMCIDNPTIRIWHTPLGDKNSLRNLRGVSL